jgi:DNA-binding beta-propeller fold protein YncE
VRRIAGDGTVGPFAGTGQPGFDGDAGPAVAAKLNYPQGVAVDGTGALYIADSGNHRVRKVAPDGTISTVAGTGDAGFGGDGGAAALARLSCPRAVVVDSAGVLYITDAGNHRVRKVAPDGTISTVAGTGDAGFGGDGGAATSAQLNSPYGLAVDDAGDLYIADCDNHRVRKVVSVKAGGLPASGTVVWWVNARSNMRMTVAGESLKDAAEIHQALASSRPAQRWRLVVVDRAGGQVFYRIENVRSGKVVEAAASAAGAVARQRAYAGDGAYHQQWELIVVGAGGGAPPVYEIVNRGSGLLLRVDSNLPPVRQGQAQADPRDGRWQLVPA